MNSPLLNAYKQGTKEYQIASDCYEYGYQKGKDDALEICRALFCKYAKGRDLEEIDRLLKEIEEMK